MNYKIVISEVTQWEEGNESEADYSHGIPASDILRAKADEEEDKIETSSWNERMEAEEKLPFKWEGEAEDEDEAVWFALQELCEKLCYGDYLEPADCEYEVEEVEDGDSEDAEGD